MIAIMTIDTTIQTIKRELIRAFALVDEWFDKDDSLHRYKPHPERWSAGEVLEHVMLTSHYLLVLIDKGTVKALKQAEHADISEALRSYDFTHPALDEVGVAPSFTWERPDHMVPTGARSLCEVRRELRDQLNRCLCTLEQLCNGEGVLYKTTMTVNNIGKLDVYQYIYFLALHAKRHLRQLEALEKEYLSLS